MIRTILVPYGGSEAAAYAPPYATALAKATGARMVFVYALEPWEHHLDMPAAAHAAAARAREAGVEAHAVSCPSRLGNPGWSLVHLASDLTADMIVLGTHARGAVGRALLGSVADYVVRHAEIPVLVCTAAGRRAWPEAGPGRLLVPLDGSALAEAALAEASALARQFGASLTLLRAIEPATLAVTGGSRLFDPTRQALAEEAQAYLTVVAQPLRDDGLAVDTLVGVGAAEAAVAEAAQDREIDLIVMATHGRGGVARLVLGSVALGTLRRSGAPVLLVRPVRLRPLAERPLEDPEAREGDVASLALDGPELLAIGQGLTRLLDEPGGDERVRGAARRLLHRLPPMDALN